MFASHPTRGISGSEKINSIDDSNQSKLEKTGFYGSDQKSNQTN
jgi:hypothetical protein